MLSQAVEANTVAALGAGVLLADLDARVAEEQALLGVKSQPVLPFVLNSLFTRDPFLSESSLLLQNGTLLLGATYVGRLVTGTEDRVCTMPVDCTSSLSTTRRSLTAVDGGWRAAFDKDALTTALSAAGAAARSITAN